MPKETLDPQYVRKVGKKLSNWGKWGPDDERGTLNYVTPDKVKAAASLVKRGNIIRLGLNYDADGPQTGKLAGRFNTVHTMKWSGSDCVTGAVTRLGGAGSADDMVVMPLQCGTQWDSLAHFFYDGKLYNGYSMAEVSGLGARRNGIDKIADGIVSRGVLLDIARYKGKEMLDLGYAVTQDDLDGCAAAQKVSVEPGDVLLVRTGHILRFLKHQDREAYLGAKIPGLSFHTLGWVHEKQIAALAMDNHAVEVKPPEIADTGSPFHMVAIRDMGLTLGEIFNFETLAENCARDGVYECLFIGAPLPFTGAVGTPLNPLAIK